MSSNLDNPNENPYQFSDSATVSNSFSETTAEATRRRLLNHETSIRSIGILYYFSGVLTLIGAVSIPYSQRGELDIMVALYIAITVFTFYVGYILRKFTRTGRILSTILAILGLLAFPIGTIINAIILYLLWSPKGSEVFSPAYQQIIAETPQIKYKSNVIMICGLILLIIVMFIAVAIGGAFLVRFR